MNTYQRMGGKNVLTSIMQRRKRRGKLVECVGNETKGGNNGADQSQLVMRQLADVSGFNFILIGWTDRRNLGVPPKNI